MLDSLLGVLRLELVCAERVVRALRARAELRMEGTSTGIDDLLEESREALEHLFLMERERVAALRELALALGKEGDTPLRLAELILYTNGERRDELMELREALRDAADAIDDLHALAGRFERRRRGRITVFHAAEGRSTSEREGTRRPAALRPRFSPFGP